MYTVEEAAAAGQSFTITSGHQVITGDALVPVLFIRNKHQTKYVRVWRFILSVGNQQGGAGGSTVLQVMDATNATGAITEPPYSAAPQNRLLGARAPVPVESRSGSTPNTLQYADSLGPLLVAENTVLTIPTELVIPYGAAVVFTFQAPPGTVISDFSVIVICSFATP